MRWTQQIGPRSILGVTSTLAKEVTSPLPAVSLMLALAMSGCGFFSDTYRLSMAVPSPSGKLEARVVYREIVDPHSRHWVLQISSRESKLTGWDNVVLEFPIDYEVEAIVWLDNQNLEVEYRRGEEDLSLIDFQTPVNGVNIRLKEKK